MTVWTSSVVPYAERNPGVNMIYLECCHMFLTTLSDVNDAHLVSSALAHTISHREHTIWCSMYSVFNFHLRSQKLTTQYV